MRDALRRWLNRIVEPTHITGRHSSGQPTEPRKLSGFVVDEWADAQWAEIADKHGIEADRDV